MSTSTSDLRRFVIASTRSSGTNASVASSNGLSEVCLTSLKINDDICVCLIIQSGGGCFFWLLTNVVFNSDRCCIVENSSRHFHAVVCVEIQQLWQNRGLSSPRGGPEGEPWCETGRIASEVGQQNIKNCDNYACEVC